MRNEHHWVGLEPNPDKYFGFIYLIECLVDKSKYVGKKQYWASKSGAVGCKSKTTDKSSIKWKIQCWRESDWKSYTGSSKDFNNHISKLGKGNFIFTILSQHETKGGLHYAEIQEQVFRDVLRKKLDNGNYEYFNRQIAAIKFRPPDTHSEATKEKLRASLKEKGHPLQGKKHPNNGKKLPQTAPKKHVSEGNIQITDGTVNKWWSKEDEIPVGFRKGITAKKKKELTEAIKESAKKVGRINHEKAKLRYLENPKYCLNCNDVIPYEHHQSWNNCSVECRSKWRSKVSSKVIQNIISKKDDVDDIYRFYHNNGDIFIGNSYNFSASYNLKISSVKLLIKGIAKAPRNKSGFSKITQYQGWRIDREYEHTE